LQDIGSGSFHAPWLEDLRAEIASFPHGRYDDQIDSIS
jgi:phage terminase large subunit-like protein